MNVRAASHLPTTAMLVTFRDAGSGTAGAPLAAAARSITPASPSLVVAALFVLVVSPTFFVEIPAMIDYVNHLARMHLLTTAGTIDANPFYEVRWKLYPNIAMDLLVPELARF